jgi:hypothetical protein
MEWKNSLKEKFERGKEDAFVWFSEGARWFTFACVLLYVAGCIVSGGVIGPIRYIEFLYHCCHFEQSAQTAAPPPCVPPTWPKFKPDRSF